jgi:hypothetical protein
MSVACREMSFVKELEDFNRCTPDLRPCKSPKGWKSTVVTEQRNDSYRPKPVTKSFYLCQSLEVITAQDKA